MAENNLSVAAGSPQVLHARVNQYRACISLPNGQTMWQWLPAGEYRPGIVVDCLAPRGSVNDWYKARELFRIFRGRAETWFVSEDWLRRDGFYFDGIVDANGGAA